MTRTITIAFLLLLLVVGCGSQGGGETSTATHTPAVSPVLKGGCGDGKCDGPENEQNCPQDCGGETSAGSRCGDGVCDEAEQADPNLCPQDCPTPTAPAPVTVEVTSAGPTPLSQPQPTLTPATAEWESVTLPSGEVAFVGDPATVSQEGGGPGAARQVNLALILDASGSMNEDLPGTGKTKLTVAKEVMAELIPHIPAEVNGTLWIYAHRRPGEPKSESCQDIEQIFPLGPVDAGAYVEKVKAIQAIGWTPIADSVELAAKGLPAGDFNSIILVSDGEETCGGDPCALAEALKASDAAVTIHVVGYAVDKATQEQLQCVAQASGGTYHDAQDAAGLLQALEEAMAATVVETTLRIEVVGPDGAEVGANARLYEAGTDRRVSGYVAWKDNLVPPASYDVVVFTLPTIIYPDLTLPEGSTTIVRIVLGAVSVVTPQGEPEAADFFEAGSGVRLGNYGHDAPLPLVPGTYYVKVNQSTSAPIAVRAGETNEVLLGAIRPLTPDGQETTGDFFDAVTDERLGNYGGTVLLVPGTYYLKVNQSIGDPITVDAGGTEELQLGSLHVDGQFEIWDAAGNRLGYYGDTLLLMPGTYRVELSDGRAIENVVVEAGKVTEVK